MLAIYKRELKSYFRSFIGLLFIAVTLFFVSLYFTVNNLLYGYPYFSYAIGGVIFVFLITVPILSMRIMAEERRSKTDQLILTAPVSVGGIIFGKFLALMTMMGRLDQERTRRMTSTPSISGSPRSSRITSGLWEEASKTADSPLTAVKYR